MFFYFRRSLDNAVLDYANTDVKNLITSIINDSVLKIINDHSVEYSDIVRSVYDPSGNLNSLSVNTSYINIIKSETVLAVLKGLSELKSQKYGIPLGNILGSRLSSGRGFTIGVSIVPFGTVASDVRNEFVSSGINQTLHRIVFDISASVSVLAPFSKASADVNTSVCIAETVILGNIPNSYFSYTN